MLISLFMQVWVPESLLLSLVHLCFFGGLRLGAEYPACFALCVVILMCSVPISRRHV